MSGRRIALVAWLVVLTAACTSTPSGEPSPSPTTPVAGSPSSTEPVGVRVAVVLPPAGEAPLTTAGTRVAVDAVASRHGSALGEVRTVATDPGAFVEDVATLLAEQGYDLVCVVGVRAAEVVLEVAAAFPATRFCAVPAPGAAGVDDPPANVLLVDLRVEEAAYLAGVAAGVAPARTTPGPDDAPRPPPAGFVGDETGTLAARQRTAFGAGLAAVLGPDATPRVDLAGDEEEVVARVAAQFEAGVPVVFVTGSAAGGGVVEAAAAHGGLLAVNRDRSRFDGATPEAVLVWFLLDAGVALDLAVSQAVDGWEGGTRSVGLVDDAIRPQAGGSELSTTTFARMREVADGIRDGSRTVPAP